MSYGDGVYVIKNNGEKDLFNREKVLQSCIRAGASVESAEKIADIIERQVYNGITTKKIMRMVRDLLRKHKQHSAYIRYPLRDALANLNPEIHEFEYFVARLLTYEGYETIRSMDPKPQGGCVDHEIDVIAIKDKEILAMECKHHYRQRKLTNLGVVMRQQARLEDLDEGYRLGKSNSINVTQVGVITNTKFTYHAIMYAKCKNIKLIGWNYPKEESINYLIEKHKAYPLTLFNIPWQIRQKLIDYAIIDSNDFYDANDSTLLKVIKDENKIRIIKNKIKKIRG